MEGCIWISTDMLSLVGFTASMQSLGLPERRSDIEAQRTCLRHTLRSVGALIYKSFKTHYLGPQGLCEALNPEH